MREQGTDGTRQKLKAEVQGGPCSFEARNSFDITFLIRLIFTTVYVLPMKTREKRLKFIGRTHDHSDPCRLGSFGHEGYRRANDSKSPALYPS